MAIGTCINWKTSFAFVQEECDDEKGGREWMVHFSEIKRNGFRLLRVGERVSFDVGTAPNGRPCAVNVTPIDEAA